ncbi:RNA-directed DNA polymerase [Aurantiacibacter gangjinensis]|uniref:Uncharacterized protein n=1 Tax=Aurantiacibacter gangjinensis TaxID=502682 RepID=A0A0G9MPA6_9SPHN|nr:RNA-directed DNA polymerase [Aurantiacibacter gangjinensis]APE28310.1 hypothetical protein BMF35_a1481 [Aurantiacibacter gangjinensis]KLE32550.1 hypothetical protein AAW01_00290 [Aurantiacibacter gangjinensis]
MTDSTKRLKALLSRGFFPNELPPPFHTNSFASSAVKRQEEWQKRKVHQFTSFPEAYSIPRHSDIRRKLSVVNPINQYRVAKLIADNWSQIKEKINDSQISEFDPVIRTKKDLRPVRPVNFDRVGREKIRIMAMYGRYIKTDVVRFYPSIYTHAVPWALLGKAYCKDNKDSQEFKTSYANLLDKAVRDGQDRQTIGIPIGPDTSRILAETIMVGVEAAVKSIISDLADRGIRYVDDLIIGISRDETPTNVLSALSSALYEFELELNAEKTQTVGMGYDHGHEWIHDIRTFEIGQNNASVRDDLDSFFESSLQKAYDNRKSNVALYAAKKASTFNLTDAGELHRIYWMMYIARRHAGALAFVAQFLVSRKEGKNFPSSDVRNFILEQIKVAATYNHTHELAWLLFAARELEMVVPADTLDRVVKLRSSVVALIIYDLWHLGRIKGAVDFSFWREFANASGLKSEMWLLSYEAAIKGWWDQQLPTDYVSDHPFFGGLFTDKVEFYDKAAKIRLSTGKNGISAEGDSSVEGEALITRLRDEVSFRVLPGFADDYS